VARGKSEDEKSPKGRKRNRKGWKRKTPKGKAVLGANTLPLRDTFLKQGRSPAKKKLTRPEKGRRIKGSWNTAITETVREMGDSA